MQPSIAAPMPPAQLAATQSTFNPGGAAAAIAHPTLELLMAVGVFLLVAMIWNNYPKVGKPLGVMILLALGVMAYKQVKGYS